MITLEKRLPVSLAKDDKGFGQVDINLNWNAKIKKKGLLGSMFRKTELVDLDLGCFVELENGKKFVLQPLGEQFGSLSAMPYVKHSGDDRTGSNSAGESLVINGSKWEKIKRVLVYAYIYEGAPVWSQTDAKVTVTCPGQEDMLIEMGELTSKKTCCALLSVENDDGDIKISKEMEFFLSQSDMDHRYQYDFKWKSGIK